MLLPRVVAKARTCQRAPPPKCPASGEGYALALGIRDLGRALFGVIGEAADQLVGRRAFLGGRAGQIERGRAERAPDQFGVAVVGPRARLRGAAQAIAALSMLRSPGRRSVAVRSPARRMRRDSTGSPNQVVRVAVVGKREGVRREAGVDLVVRPAVREIGLDQTIERVVAKAVAPVLGVDPGDAAGTVCASSTTGSRGACWRRSCCCRRAWVSVQRRVPPIRSRRPRIPRTDRCASTPASQGFLPSSPGAQPKPRPRRFPALRTAGRCRPSPPRVRSRPRCVHRVRPRGRDRGNSRAAIAVRRRRTTARQARSGRRTAAGSRCRCR